DVAVVAGNGEYRRAGATRLQRDDRALLLCQRTRRAQKLQDIAFAPLQVIAQLRRQRARGGIAAQLVAVRPDLHLAAPQLREKPGDTHTAISSRSPAPLARGVALDTHPRASIASAIVATVGRSNRLRSGRSTPNTSRTRDTTLIASRECPPSSKKSSVVPTAGTFSSSAHIRPSLRSPSLLLPA